MRHWLEYSLGVLLASKEIADFLTGMSTTATAPGSKCSAQ